MGELFLKVLNMSLTASLLIVVVILLRLVLKGAPKWVNCILWTLVAVRLVCPVSVESRFSAVPDAEPVSRVVEELQLRPEGQKEVTESPDTAEMTLPDTVVVISPEPEPIIDGTAILSYIWLGGAAVMLLYAFGGYLRLRRRVAASVPLDERVWLCDGIGSPFLLGFVRPRIYLPSSIAQEELVYVLAHERAHLARRDHWWKPLGFMLLAVHWFNPLVWAAYVLLCRDIELACDERVIREQGEGEKKAYAKALLACSVKGNTITACPLAFGEVGVKKRIRSVLHYKRPAFWLILASVTACVVLAVCFLTNPAGETKAEPSGQDYEEVEQEHTPAPGDTDEPEQAGTAPEEGKLTLEVLKELAQKGEKLTWSDFEEYPFEDIGSGLYIYRYEVDESYYLTMIGHPEIAPAAIRLSTRENTRDCIDIRRESIDEFLASGSPGKDEVPLATVFPLIGSAYLVTNGSTGERIWITEPSEVNEMFLYLDRIAIQRQVEGGSEALRVGYQYAIQTMDEDGVLSDHLCVSEGYAQLGGKAGYYVLNAAPLLGYLEMYFHLGHAPDR